MCVASVNQYSGSFKYIPKKFQTEEVCLLAIQENSELIQFVHNKTNKVCLYALRKSLWSYEYIPHDISSELNHIVYVAKIALPQHKDDYYKEEMITL